VLPSTSLPVFAQLVDRVFDESLNFRKIPPVISTNKVPEINGKPVELRPRAPDSLEPRTLRRRTWNREEVSYWAWHQNQHGGFHNNTSAMDFTSSYLKLLLFSSVFSGRVGQPAAQFSFSAVHQNQILYRQNSRKNQVIILCYIMSWVYNSVSISDVCILLAGHCVAS